MRQNYQKLIQDIGKDNFDSRFAQILNQINDFLEEAGYNDTVQCNERILYHVLLDYYSDIARLKEFHDIKDTKTDKIIAYLIFWIIRRKPIQLGEFSEHEKDIFVNERFACYMLINECLLQPENDMIGAKLGNEEMDKFEKYIDFILYYFKYRQVNAKVIELIIETFKIGRLFPIIKNN